MARGKSKRVSAPAVPPAVEGRDAASGGAVDAGGTVPAGDELARASPLTSEHLTPEESQFVYNLEVLGLPLARAARDAGVGINLAYQPHIIQARDLLKRTLRETTKITKDDVVFGMHDAIGRAKILGEPATEIRGWEAIAKILGYDAPQKIDINVRESINVIRDNLRELPDEELLRLADDKRVIDADFYVVPSK